MEENIILMTDSYKVSHWPQYPKGTQEVNSYFESRGGRFNQVLYFGSQLIIKKYLVGKVVTHEKIAEAEELIGQHLLNKKLFNIEGWKYIVNEYDGYLPVTIKTFREGCPVPVSIPLMNIKNNGGEKTAWLTNYLETLLVQTWYPTTVATLSWEIKKLILEYLKATGDETLIDFKLHDFGFRGVSSVESAGIGGLAHLINFKGTDTMEALVYAKRYYNAKEAVGYSIPASEHSTITSWGKNNEEAAYANMLEQYPTGLVACVSDSYDIFNACKNIWGDKLKAKVLNRDGTLVIRPDSGHPPTIVLKVLEILGEQFGYEINEKGYKVLNPKVRIIQGDGVDYDMIKEILSVMRKHNWSADNIAFGMGGALLQKLNRDTQKFAFKCCSVVVDGQERDVWKDPITDAGKASKRGRMKVVLIDGPEGPYYKPVASNVTTEQDNLIKVFENGKLITDFTFDEVRKNVENNTQYWDIPSID